MSASILPPNRISPPSSIPRSNSINGQQQQRYNSSNNNNNSSPINTISSWKSNTSTDASNNTAEQKKSREVDYYLNPTELFRWINYRRWDGAKARAESHPEEVSTWIVSKNTNNDDERVNNGSRVLWRHLPLHLVCMQVGSVGGSTPSNNMGGSVSGTNNSSPLSQVEGLVDLLISIYPDGVSQVDEKGMLPIHQAVSNGASERIINLLLLSHPASVNVRDKYNRTPMDIINEIPASSRRDATRMALHRASEKINALASAVRNESADDIAKVQLSAANERVASQRIIMRMEDEVTDATKIINGLKEECNTREYRENQYQDEIHKLKEQLESTTNHNNKLQNERDDVRISLDKANSKIKDHDIVIQGIKQLSNKEMEMHTNTISNLKSEVATSKAMSDALEEQLRSRFAQEEYLNNLVVELQNKLHTSTEALNSSIKVHEEQMETTKIELEKYKKNIDDITKRNMSYQNRIGELNKQISSLLASQASFQAEHDRLIESSNRHENDLLEAINSERERMVRSIKKQKSFFDTVLGEQEVIMDDAVQKEKDIRFDYGQDRERSLVAVEQLHTQFKTLHAAERERKLKQNNSNIHHHSMDFYKNSNTNNSVAAGSDRGGASSVNGSIATATNTSNNLRRSPATDITSNVSNKNVFNGTSTMQDEPLTKIQSPIFTTPRPQQNRQPSLSPPVGMKTPPHLSRQHSASSQQHKKEQQQQHAYQSPHSVMQTIPQQSSTSASVHNNSPQPPPPLHYASSAFNQPHYHPNNQSPMQSSSYQQQQYHPQSTPPPQPITKTSPTSRSLIVRTPLVEESSSTEKGFEIMNVREETPPFEMVTPPSTTRRQQVNDFHFNTSRKVPIIPSATATTSSSNYNNIYEDNNEDDDDDDESAVTPGPVRSGQLLRFLEDRADHEQKYHVIDNNDDASPSNSSRHYHPKTTRNPYNNRLHSSSQSANMRSIALADNTDDYSQASSSSSSASPSSVTGYAYRTTTRTRNTVLTKTTSLSNNGDNINNNIGAATTSTTNTGDIGEF